jgi:amino acid adenylation domain-containing protein
MSATHAIPGSAESGDPVGIAAIFERAAATHPAFVALSDDVESLSYAELDARANRLAHHLIARGLMPGALVAILLERSIDAVVAVLAVAKAGAAYAPLGVEHPPERLAFMLENAAPALVISRTAHSGALSLGRSDLIELDRDRNEAAVCRSDAPKVLHPRDGLAFCIFTSGSTGRPKGVLVSNRGVAALVAAQRDMFGVKPQDRVLQFASLGFDAFLFDLLMAFGSGARLVLRGDRIGQSLADFMTEQAITIATMPPSLIGRMDLRGVSSLRCLIAAGEACSSNHVRMAPLHCTFVNAYGPTEATIWATAHTVSANTIAPAALPIGHAVAATRVDVLNDALAPAVIGEVGEIYLAGEALAWGYLGAPGMTAERFVPDPFGRPGARVYRTGDRGRRRENGEVEFCGRVDQQIKLRGFRVELGEIEASLRRLAGVREAAVVARRGGGDEIELLACIVAPELGADDVVELRRQLEAHLPHYMIPARWRLLDALPLNPSGKVDRKALEAEARFIAAATCGKDPPRTPAEQLLAQLWCDVLGLDEVGRADGFRSLGGSSIQAIEVAHRAGAAFGLVRDAPLPLGNVTIADYAASIAETKTGDELSSEATRTPRDVASHAQQQVCYLEQLGDAWRAYRAHSRLDITGVLDRDALEQALAALLARHDILRTGFERHGGIWRRILVPDAKVVLRVVDASGTSGDVLAEVIQRELSHRFDVSAAPLVRWALVRFADDRHTLIQSEHHLVHDGLSSRILVNELAEIYSAIVERRRPDLLAEVADYSEFCIEEDRWRASKSFTRELASWTARLAPFEGDLRLFSHLQAPAPRRFVGAQARRCLDHASMARAGRVAAALGVSAYALMLAAFALLCGRLSRQRRMLIGSGLANRPARFRNTVGMFVNMAPLPIDLGASHSFVELVHAVAAEIDFALAHGGVSMSEVAQSLGWSQRLEGETLFNVGFSLHDSRPADRAFSGLDVTLKEALSNGSAKFDLNVVAIPNPTATDRATEVIAEYNSDMFNAADVESLLTAYEALLARLVADPNSALADVSMLASDQRGSLLADWNDTDVEYPRDSCIHKLFEDQAARRPEAIALTCAGRMLSYGELNARANQLAHYLRALGVTSDSIVAVTLERDIDMVVTLLGILKAGGAYLPIPPGHPQARALLMLRDARVGVLVSSSDVAAALAAHVAQVVLVDGDRAAIAKQPRSDLRALGEPASLAYCMYTSGSTGAPKGVGVTHRGVVRLVKSSNYAALNENEVFFHYAPLGFDASTFELWASLLNGARLVIMAPGEATFEELAETIRDTGVSTLFLTAALFEHFCETHAGALTNVRQLLSGGDVLPTRTVRHVLTEIPSCKLINAYGPTEASAFATCHTISPAFAGKRVPIGRPISNTQIYILDEFQHPLPVAGVGEIHVGGPGLARGYVGRAALTAERFVPAIDGARGGRLYRTGDLGRWLADGSIEFLGRFDHQVKLRGFRVELGEIEAALRAQDGVREAAVTAPADETGEKRLTAYVVGASGVQLDAGALRAALRRVLPDYMTPATWIFLDALPLTPTGKLDRKALSAVKANASTPKAHAEEIPEPHAERTAAMIAILEDLLPGQRIGARDDLFAAGVHSLLMMRFVASCRAQLGVELSLRDIYRLATPLAIAEAVGAASSAG